MAGAKRRADGRFVNNHRTVRNTSISGADFAREYLQTSGSGRAPKTIPCAIDSAPDDCLVWLGHAGFLIRTGGQVLLTDPHLGPRASPLPAGPPARLQRPPLRAEQMPPVDAVLISHNHYDHLDAGSVRALARHHDPAFVVPLGLASWFTRRGMPRVTERDWWQHTDIDGTRITAVPVQHFSGRTAFDRNRSLWCGFVIEREGRRIFFAGDTGYGPDFAAIGERFAPIDLALLPIGAYSPRSFMRPVHVNPAEAVRIHQDIGARRSVAMHWGTFRLTTEPLDEPPRALAAARDAAGLAVNDFEVMRPGEIRAMDALLSNE